MLGMSGDDRTRIGEAITAAELGTDGEIVAATTPFSDAYHDVALHWAVAVLIAVLAWFAAFPGTLSWADGLVAAIGLVGAVLATHFPKTDADTNEIPDRLVEL